jgi:hypothetical protein
MSDEIKIRTLKRKDRKTVAAMLRKLADKIGSNGILNIISSEKKSDKADENAAADSADAGKVFAKIGIDLVKTALEFLEDDVAAWFADLVGKTPEEFDEMPFDVEMVIIDQLVNAEEANSFFTRALQIYNKIRKSVTTVSTEKME